MDHGTEIHQNWRFGRWSCILFPIVANQKLKGKINITIPSSCLAQKHPRQEDLGPFHTAASFTPLSIPRSIFALTCVTVIAIFIALMFANLGSLQQHHGGVQTYHSCQSRVLVVLCWIYYSRDEKKSTFKNIRNGGKRCGFSRRLRVQSRWEEKEMRDFAKNNQLTQLQNSSAAALLCCEVS